MNIDPQLQKIIDFYNSPQGQELIKQEKKHQEFLDNLKNDRLLWFYSIGPEKRSHYINKIIKKYKSDSYVKRWMDRGIFPPENLFFDIYDYAYKYGKCWRPVANEVGPGYDSKFVFDDWKVLLYNGQGSIVIIEPLTDEDREKGPDEYSQRLLGHEYSNYYETLTDEFT
jgi:hypothetical protein